MEVGENERIDFYEGVSAIGLPFKREGRIPFEEVEECGIDNVWSFLQDSSNPKGDIKTAFKLVTKKGLEQVNAGVDKNRGLRKADKPAVKERNEGIHNEIVRLQKEKPKLVITDNVFWSIYKIARGEKRKAGFIKDGRNLEEIYYINELITSEDLKILKEKRAEYYGSD